MYTIVTVKASALRAGDIIISGRTKIKLSIVVVDSDYVSLWDEYGIPLGSVSRGEEVKVAIKRHFLSYGSESND